jgi:hypothetical protein
MRINGEKLNDSDVLVGYHNESGGSARDESVTNFDARTRERDLGRSLELSSQLLFIFASYFGFQNHGFVFRPYTSSVTSLKTILPTFYYRFGFQ